MSIFTQIEVVIPGKLYKDANGAVQTTSVELINFRVRPGLVAATNNITKAPDGAEAARSMVYFKAEAGIPQMLSTETAETIDGKISTALFGLPKAVI